MLLCWKDSVVVLLRYFVGSWEEASAEENSPSVENASIFSECSADEIDSQAADCEAWVESFGVEDNVWTFSVLEEEGNEVETIETDERVLCVKENLLKLVSSSTIVSDCSLLWYGVVSFTKSVVCFCSGTGETFNITVFLCSLVSIESKVSKIGGQLEIISMSEEIFGVAVTDGVSKGKAMSSVVSGALDTSADDMTWGVETGDFDKAESIFFRIGDGREEVERGRNDGSGVMKERVGDEVTGDLEWRLFRLEALEEENCEVEEVDETVNGVADSVEIDADVEELAVFEVVAKTLWGVVNPVFDDDTEGDVANGVGVADPVEGVAGPVEGVADPVEGVADSVDSFSNPMEGFTRFLHCLFITRDFWIFCGLNLFLWINLVFDVEASWLLLECLLLLLLIIALSLLLSLDVSGATLNPR